MPISFVSVYVTNQSAGNAAIQLLHRVQGSSSPPDVVFQRIAAGEVIRIDARYETGPDARMDLWFASIKVLDGPNRGVVASTPGTLEAPEFSLKLNDENGALTASISSTTFGMGYINEGGMLLLKPGTPAPMITHVFVLMLENRSFDNLLGFANLQGVDPSTGNATTLSGLVGNESNAYNNIPYAVKKGAKPSMTTDPGHEFIDVYNQMSGTLLKWPGSWQSNTNAGFVMNYATSTDEGPAPIPDNYGDIMACFDSPHQVPVLYQLAQEFAVCDHWYASMPGPTWPNRFFAMAASSGAYDDSPSTWRMGMGETLHGFHFPHGNLFDALGANNLSYQLYNDYDNQFGTQPAPITGRIPIVGALQGQSALNVKKFSNFANDLKGNYPYAFTFIEPNYGHITHEYVGGSSQHPMDTLGAGERLIAATYNAIRNSPLWETSLLIVTYDEHGGFYDHLSHDTAVNPPNDGSGGGKDYGFNFGMLGVRVPAVVISPLIAKNTIDHRVYDHSTILKTVESNFIINPLTDRDNNAQTLLTLLSLAQARTDCPQNISAPAATAFEVKTYSELEKAAFDARPLPEKGNIHGFLLAAAKTHHELNGKSAVAEVEINARVQSMQTYGDARAYIEEVQGMANERIV